METLTECLNVEEDDCCCFCGEDECESFSSPPEEEGLETQKPSNLYGEKIDHVARYGAA